MVANTNVVVKPHSNLTSQHDNNFSDLILWSSTHFHQLPWRQNRSFYSTLISELMLQQTTVAGVWHKYLSFLERFPSWQRLREASLPDLLEQWKGLGYYQRPKSLYALAQLNSTEDDLIAKLLNNTKQPAIGPYTAGALLSIGLDQPATALDANIRRVLARYTGLPESFETIYHRLLSTYSPRALNEALMDLGRERCQARKALCAQCPLQSTCASANSIDAVLLRELALKKPPQRLEMPLIRLIVQAPNQTLLGTLKPSNTWLSGYIELPTWRLPSTEDGHQCTQYPLAPKALLEALSNLPFTSLKGQITKYTLRSRVYTLSEDFLDLALGEETLDLAPSLQWYHKDDPLWAKPALKAIQGALVPVNWNH